MAELEVVKSTKKIFEAAKSKEISLWEKIKEIGLEIAIIGFAVTLSIGFHSWSEYHHEQSEVENFLKGLRTDLQKDIVQMKDDIQSYQSQKEGYVYLSGLRKGEIANLDSLNRFSPYTFSFTRLESNSGRYEGFKSSGKMNFIEDEDLQNNILVLYEEEIPKIKNSNKFYIKQKVDFTDYLIDHTVDFPNGNYIETMSSEPTKNRSRMFLSKTENIIEEYQAGIATMEKIIEQINSHYPQKEK